MTIHHPMLGKVASVLQGVTVHVGQPVINARLSGMFGGDAQLVLSEAEALKLSEELARAVATIRSHRPAATGS